MKKGLKTIILVFIIFGISYSVFSVFEYGKWLKTKEAVAAGGYPWQCGGTTLVVQPACARACLGKCCCAMCDAACDGSTQVIFTPQPVCAGLNFMCVQPNQLVNGTPIQMAQGMQFIAGNTSANLFYGNGVLATPSLAANNVQNLVDDFDFIIAGIKEVINK